MFHTFAIAYVAGRAAILHGGRQPGAAGL